MVAVGVETPQLRVRALRRLAALHLEIVPVVAVAAVLDLWRLGQNGWANVFYSAAVRSMSSSWHDFFYASLDRTGVMTVDKPPLALWVQALSVRLFGFHPLSILVPQAVMGMATVALVYDMVRRRFGRAAGVVAGLVLATTPITVAISRHNNPDALLILCCTAALWCTVRALESGRVGWLLGAGACVGLGFETKMAVALVVVPGIAAAWLWAAPHGRLAAFGQLLKSGFVALVVGVAWPLFVALTPVADRPWISGTADNSIWSLIVGYNGVGRVAGQVGGPGQVTASLGSWVFGGYPGPFRLFDQALGIQAGWLVGLAVVGSVAIVVASRLRRGDARTGWLLAVGGSFAAAGVVFSAAKGIFHPYYVSLLAPFTAALVGAGVAEAARSGKAARVLAPLAVAAGVASEVAVIHQNRLEPAAAIPWLIVCAVVAGGLLAVFAAPRVRAAALAVALAALLVTPAIAAVDTLGHRTSGTFPAGGPLDAGIAGAHVTTRILPRRSEIVRRELRDVLRYVRARGGALGVRSQSQAAYEIIDRNANIAGLGGWSGQETEMSPAWFGLAVRQHRVRWVFFHGSTRVIPGRRIGATKLLRAVVATCRRVPRKAYAPRLRTASGRLYDCRHAWRVLEGWPS